jgi:hypothetical protein
MATCVAVFLASTGIPRGAHADAYSWGGSSGRFAVSVFRAGFNEGFGEGGWDADSARDFASWAARFNAVVPRGAFVTMERGVDDDGTRLSIHRLGRVQIVRMTDGPDLDAALPIVARAFGLRPPGPRGSAPPRLFTVQIFASGSEARATRFAAALDERGVVSEGSFFHEECHPCFVHDSHVLEARRDGLHRVVIGVFDRRAPATRWRWRLRRTWKVDGFVREL